MFTVLTKSGVMLETEDASEFVMWCDELGSVIVDHAAPPEQWTDLSRALMEKLLPDIHSREAGSCQCKDCR
jgi:hypothetical protein